MAPKLFLKIYRVTFVRILGGSKVSTALGKDKDGTKCVISIWDKYIPKVEANKIYEMKNLMVDKYPTEKPHNLTTCKTTIIDDVTEEKTDEFKNVIIGDEQVFGKIDAFHSVRPYLSCGNCMKKITGETGPKFICSNCKRATKKINQDFKFEVLIEKKRKQGEDNEPEDSYQNLVGFKKVLVNVNEDLGGTADEIEANLNEKFCGLRAYLEFDKDPKRGEDDDYILALIKFNSTDDENNNE